MSDLQREPQQHNLPSFFYQNEDGNFCLCCCHCSLRLLRCRSGWCQSIVCIACPASVLCMTHGPSVTWLYVFIVFHEFFIACFVLISMFSSPEIWGMNMPNLPEVSRLEDLLVLGCVHCAVIAAIHASCDDVCCCGMSIIVTLMRSSWRLCCICQQGRLVALRLIAMALLVRLEERSSCERFGTSQWWRWLSPLWSVLASIFDRAHCNWQWRRCLLLLVATVPSSNACVVFTARIFNSLITIQRELSMD